MVDSVNSSTSKLLEQIKRLSAQTNNNKEVENRNFKKEVENAINNRASDIREKVNVSHLGKISKKSDVSAFVIEGVKTGEVRKSVQTPEVAQIPTTERKLYKEPLGNLLDAYL